MKLIIFCLSLVLIFSSSLLSQHRNVKILGPAFGPNEPSICIDRKNTNNLVVGSNLDLYAYSHDGGLTWKSSILKSQFGVWGDPVIICDTNSDFYFFHLSSPPYKLWLDRIVCQKSTDGGNSWSDSSFTKTDGRQHDKQWATVDTRNNKIYMTWTAFDRYQSTNPNDSSHILFSYSDDGGTSWSDPLRIDARGGDCMDDDNSVEGAVPAVGPGGEVYVTWSGHEKIYFNKSTDGGKTWLDNNPVIADQYGGWVYDIPGLQRCNGLPVIDCDIGGSAYHGNIYVNYTDQKYGEFDTDVWLIKSTDGGDSWSVPKRVNDDAPGKQQFLTWMSIDQASGFIYFIFYDRRNHFNNGTDVFMAVSKDGGETFINFKVSEKPFFPNDILFLGDYNNITAHNGIVRPVWTRMDNERSVWTAIINTDSMITEVAYDNGIFNNMELEQNYPNPFSKITNVTFKLNKPALINFSLYNMHGDLVSTLINNEMYFPGKYNKIIDAAKLELVSGVYYYVLRSAEGMMTKKLISINEND